jgi:hypothetical protein
MLTEIDPVQTVLFGGARGVLRTIVFGIIAYVALIAMLRLTGKHAQQDECVRSDRDRCLGINARFGDA